jgi:hypothetical protein
MAEIGGFDIGYLAAELLQLALAKHRKDWGGLESAEAGSAALRRVVAASGPPCGVAPCKDSMSVRGIFDHCREPY